MENLVSEEAFIGTYRYRVFAEKALGRYGDWLTVQPSPKLAEIVASLLTDGHLEGRKVKGHYKYDYIGYFSKNTEDLEHFNELLDKVFGIQGTMMKWGRRINGSSMGIILCNAALSRILYICGAERGDKITKEYRLPLWIANGDYEIKAAFLRRSFSCEGSVCNTVRNNRWEIKYSMGKTEELVENGFSYLNSMRKMLDEFGIETTPVTVIQRLHRSRDGKITAMLRFRIKRKSFVNFRDRIGFDIAYKNSGLQKATEWASTFRDSLKLSA
ncbi:MAG: LAGLIDADG family homing endonuclease [Candidatus Micrarchaeota archaeon]